jgi:hypothetical protein
MNMPRHIYIPKADAAQSPDERTRFLKPADGLIDTIKESGQ